MNRFRLFLLGMIPVVALLCTAPASAQSPESQFGIQAGTPGLGVQYAITAGIHIGLVLGLNMGDNTLGGPDVSLTPYAKFLMKGTVKPYIMAGVDIGSSEGTGGQSTTTTMLFAALGLEYFINENVGVFGQSNVFEIGLDPSSTSFGIAGGHVGVEWFFDR